MLLTQNNVTDKWQNSRTRMKGKQKEYLLLVYLYANSVKLGCKYLLPLWLTQRVIIYPPIWVLTDFCSFDNHKDLSKERTQMNIA